MFTLQKGPRDVKFNSRNPARCLTQRLIAVRARPPRPELVPLPGCKGHRTKQANRCSARPEDRPRAHFRYVLHSGTYVTSAPSFKFPTISFVTQRYTVFTLTSCLLFTSAFSAVICHADADGGTWVRSLHASLMSRPWVFSPIASGSILTANSMRHPLPTSFQSDFNSRLSFFSYSPFSQKPGLKA